VTRPPAGGAGPEASGEQSPGAVAEDAFPLGKSLARWITSTAAGLVANAFEVLLKFLLMLFILFYFFKDGAEILKSIENAIPLDRASQERVVTTFRRVSQSVVRGSFLTALAQGAVATVAFAIVGLPAIFWGVMAAFCALIPPIGTSLVTIPLTISFLVHQEWWQGIFLGVVSVAIGTMDNFLKPYLVGGSLHMHPIWLLLSILGAMRLFGPLGIIYGPLVLVLLGTFVALLVRAEGSRALGSTVGGGKEAQT
jgi:predicted PurR-regulated permease PerM